jgi:hypothetical protein
VGARFFAHVQTGPGAHPASCTMGTGSFLGVKRPWRGTDHPPLLAPRSSMSRSIPHSPSGPSVACYRETFTLRFRKTLHFGKTLHFRKNSNFCKTLQFCKTLHFRKNSNFCKILRFCKTLRFSCVQLTKLYRTVWSRDLFYTQGEILSRA